MGERNFVSVIQRASCWVGDNRVERLSAVGPVVSPSRSLVATPGEGTRQTTQLVTVKTERVETGTPASTTLAAPTGTISLRRVLSEYCDA